MDYNNLNTPYAQKASLKSQYVGVQGAVCDSAPTPRTETDINRIIDRLERMISLSANTLNNQLNFIGRLRGERAENEKSGNCIKPCRSGSIGKIEDLLDNLTELEQQIFQNQVLLDDLA